MNESATEAAAYEEEALSCSGAEQDPLFEFITNGVLLNAIGALGVLGNVISMVILSRPQMRSSINYLLVGLARCDTMLILTSVLLFGLPAIHTYTGALFTYKFKVYPHLVPVVYPLALISQTVSVYLTLTVTLERFVAVCHPLRARSLCTYGRARLYVLVIIALSALYNLPRFWEAEIDVQWDDERNTTVMEVVPTALRRNHLYVTVYINWLYMALLYFLPFTVLAVLNTAIYRQVRRANKERQRLSRLQKKEIGLATMLLCVVVVFFLCNLLALVNNVMEVFYCGTIDQLVKTSNLLITINSSVNFIIYVIFGEKFKRLFLKLFCSSHMWAAVTGVSATAGRESPDGATHDDSLVSNGDGRGYSLRVGGASGGGLRAGGHHAPLRNGSMRPPRAPSPGPCVYYPARATGPPPSPSPTPTPTPHAPALAPTPPASTEETTLSSMD
ncbi:hypothetical protein R5R35_001723 [Gryllus longicercus]|uniref:G-protein coupled receptors family 1 profile domain-containing protein n=1 Tax=Gryllus longicercus TaxID=2509291 RepID=A0AAN9ZEY9_9ORTH